MTSREKRIVRIIAGVAAIVALVVVSTIYILSEVSLRGTFVQVSGYDDDALIIGESYEFRSNGTATYRYSVPGDETVYSSEMKYDLNRFELTVFNDEGVHLIYVYDDEDETLTLDDEVFRLGRLPTETILSQAE